MTQYYWTELFRVGQTPSTESQAANAAETELKKEGLSDKEKAQAAASAAAGIAATAACAELGPGAIACGVVASAVTGYLVGAVSDLFGSSGPPTTPITSGQIGPASEFLTDLYNTTVAPLTKKKTYVSETKALLISRGAQDQRPVTVWSMPTNIAVFQKYEAEILGQAATLKAKQVANKKKSSAAPLVIGGVALLGGMLFLTRRKR